MPYILWSIGHTSTTSKEVCRIRFSIDHYLHSSEKSLHSSSNHQLLTFLIVISRYIIHRINQILTGHIIQINSVYHLTLHQYYLNQPWLYVYCGMDWSNWKYIFISSFNSMDHFITLLFVYLLKVGIILLWHNARFSWRMCNNNWFYKTWYFDTAQCGDYIAAHHYITSFKDFLAQEEEIKVLFQPLIMTDYITPSDHHMLQSNLQFIMTSIWILKTMSHLHLEVWY